MAKDDLETKQTEAVRQAEGVSPTSALCPLRNRPCTKDCAWHNGAECAVHMIGQEMYMVVEGMATLLNARGDPGQVSDK